MLLELSIGTLLCSIVLYVIEKVAPQTALGRFAHRIFAVSFVPRSLKDHYALTGRHVFFIGIGWKTLLLLFILMRLFSKGCAS